MQYQMLTCNETHETRARSKNKLRPVAASKNRADKSHRVQQIFYVGPIFFKAAVKNRADKSHRVSRPRFLLTFKASRSQGKIVCPLHQILSDVRFNYRGRKGFAIAYIVSKEWYSLRSEKKREE